MSNLLNDIFENIGEEGMKKVGGKFDLDEKVAKDFSGGLFGMMEGALAKNIKKGGGFKIKEVLEKDHAGNLDILDDIISGNVDKKGDGILGHVFGGSKSKVLKALAKKNNISTDQAGGLMKILAPIFMGSLSKTMSKTKMDENVLGDILEMASKTDLKKDGLIGVAKKLLDLDGDGKVVDDIPKLFAIVKKFFVKK